MDKIVKENLNEELEWNEKADEIFAKEVSRLRNTIFPKMSDEELQYFMKRLYDWTGNMLG